MPVAVARRRFVTVGERQVHYWRAGEGPPVVLLHDSPRSSLALAPLAAALAERFCVVALDTPGYGSSEPLAVSRPEIPDYADALVRTLDALGIGRCGLYGAGSGASIAAQCAWRAGDRVAAIVLDEPPLFGAPERADLLAHHCPPIEPAIDGSHLIAAWTAHRDQFLFRPWYRRELAARRDVDMPDATALHDGFLDLLRAGAPYGAAFEAAVRHDCHDAIARLAMPALVLAPDDGARERVVGFLAEHLGDVRAAPPAPPAASIAGAITRDYADTSHGQLLVRRAGGGGDTPLLMLHASPGSAGMLVPLIRELARGRPVLAFDTLGNGGSDKPPWHAAEIRDYAPVVAEALDALGIGAVDLYGTHTGAKIALETCLLDPARVRRLVLDGLALYSDAQRDDLLARYTPVLAPSDDGTHLLMAWSFLRDQTLFWPWYDRTRGAIRRVEPIGARELHAWLVELLQSGPTYSIAYRAAFRHPTRERLPLLATPTLLAARGTDMIHATTIEAARLAQRATAMTLPEDDAGSAAVIARFLDA